MSLNMASIKHTDNEHLQMRLRYIARKFREKDDRKFIFSQTINPGYVLNYGNFAITVIAPDIESAQRQLQTNFKSLLRFGTFQYHLPLM